MDLANKAVYQEHVQGIVKDLLLAKAHQLMAITHSLSGVEFSEDTVELQAQILDLLAKGMK